MIAFDSSTPAASVMDPGAVEQLTELVVNATHDVLGESLIAVIVKGSAITGDFYPHFSDFDVHVYVAERMLRASRTLKAEYAFQFQSRIADLDPADYGVSQAQVIFLSGECQTEDWTPPMPNSYRVVYGRLPEGLHQIDGDVLLLKARADLQGLKRRADSLLESMVDKPDNRLSPSVRLTGTFLKPGLRQAAMLLGASPVDVWAWPLHDVLSLVEPEVLPAREASRFFTFAQRWLEVQVNGPSLREMAGLGIRSLDALAEFGQERGR